MKKPNPTIEYINKLDKWGQEYCRIYQRLYQRKKRNIISKDEIELFELMKQQKSLHRNRYQPRIKFDKGEKIMHLNIKHEKILVEFD